MQYNRREMKNYPPMMDDSDTSVSSDAQAVQEAVSGTAQ